MRKLSLGTWVLIGDGVVFLFLFAGEVLGIKSLGPAWAYFLALAFAVSGLLLDYRYRKNKDEYIETLEKSREQFRQLAVEASERWMRLTGGPQ